MVMRVSHSRGNSMMIHFFICNFKKNLWCDKKLGRGLTPPPLPWLFFSSVRVAIWMFLLTGSPYISPQDLDSSTRMVLTLPSHNIEKAVFYRLMQMRLLNWKKNKSRIFTVCISLIFVEKSIHSIFKHSRNTRSKYCLEN